MADTCHGIMAAGDDDDSLYDLTMVDDRDAEHRRRIMVAVDGSEASKQTFAYVLKKVALVDDDLLLILHVRPDVRQMVGSERVYSCVRSTTTAERKCHEASKALLDEYQAIGGRGGINYFKLLSECGEPREKVVECAMRERADILVMADESSRQTLMQKLLQGKSLPEYCLHHSPCSVLLVQPRHLGLCS